ncbi:MAG: hypothetical protein FJ104_04540, partial [Deltaproteobacteria bacterium]|nr:hypothetical protein [Deltaproteobacteria bacterium]
FLTAPQARTHAERDDAAGRYAIVAAPGYGYSYRWDADADGKPDDDEFGSKDRVELAVGEGEIRSVVLEVKNSFGRVGRRTVKVARPAAPAETASAAQSSDDRLALRGEGGGR